MKICGYWIEFVEIDVVLIVYLFVGVVVMIVFGEGVECWFVSFVLL